MRLAFVDLVFSWPPLGGAPADLYYTIRGLQDMGHECHLFFATDPERWDRGELDTSTFGFPATRLDFTEEEYTPDRVPQAFREVVDQWTPDIVFMCFGFFMKPFVTEALAHYPMISRYYAYEPACPRDYLIFKNQRVCPQNYLNTPNVCRRCTFQHLGKQLRSVNPLGYTKEYLATKAYTPAFRKRLIESIQLYKAVIVYNQIGVDHLRGYHDNVHAIGGGVILEDFDFTPLPDRGKDDKKIILMSGRAKDKAKGASVLFEAGHILAQTRNDFEIWLTHGDIAAEKNSGPWAKDIGWLDHSGIVQLYKQSDICVVPSVWEEPFGLVAVEAMATGRPVAVARVGGLQNIPIHGETGYVYDRYDSAALAEHLHTLLDSFELRKRFGQAGRKRVEENFTWRQVIEKHYPPLLDSVLRT